MEKIEFEPEVKEAIKARIIKHFEDSGHNYPEIHPIVVLEELENIYRILEDEKLFPFYIPFEIFKNAALKEFMKAQAQSFLEDL